MVEKIIVNPEKIRGYGNIIISKNPTDYDKYENTLTQTTDTVYGATETVFNMSPITYNMSFDSSSYITSTGIITVQVTVLKNNAPVNNVLVRVNGGGGSGSATTNGNGVATVYVSGITESGTLTATCGFSKATATVTYNDNNYNLTFSQSTYTCGFDGVTVSCTLKEENTPMSGKTITFTYEGMLGPTSVTATTNSSGVATQTFDYFDFDSLPATVTAEYQGVTTTCTIVEG